MRMGRNTWFYVALILICFSGVANASGSWVVAQYQDGTGQTYSSTVSAKTAARGLCHAIYPPASNVNSSARDIGENRWMCQSGCAEGFCDNGNVVFMVGFPSGGGVSCVGTGEALTAFGHITNNAGQCVDYVNADTPSQCKSLAGTSGFKSVYVSFDSDGNPQTPPPIRVAGCEAIPVDLAHCTMAPKRVFPTGGSIQPTTNKCKIAVSFTGNTLGTAPIGPPISSGPGADGVCTGECPDIPPAPIDNDTQPCTYVYDGEGRKVCSSSNFNYSPGNSSCGTVNGTFQCVGKAPATNGIVIDTKITDTTNPDGSKTSVKKDTATQIICNSPKPCVATTTTNTTTTNYNSSGAKTGQSTSCTGAACSTDGKGDADGDGLQDCVVGKCEETEGVDVGAQDWHETGDETFGTAFEGFTSRVTAAPVMKAGDKFFAFNPSGSCPVWSVNVWVFSVTLDQHCSTDIPWDVIKAIIMACAGFVAFRWALL